MDWAQTCRRVICISHTLNVKREGEVDEGRWDCSSVRTANSVAWQHPEAEQRLYLNGQPHVTVIFPFILNCFHTAAAVGSEHLGGSSFPVADDRSELHSAWRGQMV